MPKSKALMVNRRYSVTMRKLKTAVNSSVAAATATAYPSRRVLLEEGATVACGTIAAGYRSGPSAVSLRTTLAPPLPATEF
jgi:hypothetical protein